jgi:hypothetical protein
MTEVLVRSATDADLVAAARVHARGWQAAYRGLVPAAVLAGMDPERTAARWRAATAAGGGDRARRFYERFGFRADGERAVYRISRQDAQAQIPELRYTLPPTGASP